MRKRPIKTPNTFLDRRLDLGPNADSDRIQFYIQVLYINKKITLRVLKEMYPNSDWCQADIDERIESGILKYEGA